MKNVNLSDHKTLLTQLRKLSKALQKNVENLNSGGCGVVAGMVGLELQKAGIMCEVVTPVGYGSQPAAAVRANVKNSNDANEWSSNGLNRAHLAIRFRSNKKTYTWDSESLRQSVSQFGKGLFSEFRTSSKFGDGLSIKETIKMSAKQEGWNPYFNREQIPLVQHLVNHYLVFGLD